MVAKKKKKAPTAARKALGRAVAAKAAKNKKFGKAIDKIPHKSAARMKKARG